MVDIGVIARSERLAKRGIPDDITFDLNMTRSRSKRLAARDGGIEDQLLPGILDDITVDRIAPKLPWIACQRLSSVSHGWQRAIQSRQIYDARVRAQSTQAFVVMNHDLYHANESRALAVYLLSDGSCYNLPPIVRGVQIPPFPRLCRCASLDNKLYVLGGLIKDRHGDFPESVSTEVHVLDLAGQMQWKRCASMKYGRQSFGCGVMNGKIYVFGGVCNEESVLHSEVYEPEKDVWSPIARMKPFNKTCRSYELVTAGIGEELFVHIGERYRSGYHCPRCYDSTAQVYHPMKDQWRSVDRFTERHIAAPLRLEMGGKLHKLTRHGIDVYDICKNSWERLQSCASTNSMLIEPVAAVAVKDEFLALVQVTNFATEDKPISAGFNLRTSLMRGQGFGCDNSKIAWKRAQCSLSFDNVEIPFLSVVHL